MISDEARRLLAELARISKSGPVKGLGTGSPSVGMTLLDRLGIRYQSTEKPRKDGIVVSARRGSKKYDPHRVNLFAKVPDWKFSSAKSSAEILRRYGYERDGGFKLNCTVSAAQANTQGLRLRVDYANGYLEEFYESGARIEPVANWEIGVLKEKLTSSRPETMWVTATSTKREDSEYFHYRYAVYSGRARVEALPGLISEGTVTVDHLINDELGKITERGPLFKIKPKNLSLLFPDTKSFDLMSI